MTCLTGDSDLAYCSSPNCRKTEGFVLPEIYPRTLDLDIIIHFALEGTFYIVWCTIWQSSNSESNCIVCKDMAFIRGRQRDAGLKVRCVRSASTSERQCWTSSVPRAALLGTRARIIRVGGT